MIRLGKTRWMGLILGAVFGMGSLAGCGHSVDASNDSSSSADGVAVNGVGGFGTQCMYGTLGDPLPVKLTAFGCPSKDNLFQLGAPLLPIVLQADCKKMEVTARTIDGNRIENRWNALPDGRFFFTMDAGNASLGSNGAGASNCQTTTTVEIAGLMKCRDRDHVEVQVDATWHLGQTMPGTTPHLTGQACAVPKDCNLHGFTILKQCG